jgi:uridine kinase
MRVTDFTKPNNFIPFILGVSGGSGSGKTYFANELQRALGEDCCTIIYQDNFYIDQSHRFDFDGGSVNFDHPESIEFPLLAQHLEVLKSCKKTCIPTYDFVTHSRTKKTLEISPCQIVIVDGILIFHSPEVRAMLDDLVFFDTPEDLRFQRRLHRDVHERGRAPEGVRNQFLQQVKPMHDQFVAPSMSYAKTIVHEVDDYEEIFGMYLEKLKLLIQK